MLRFKLPAVQINQTSRFTAAVRKLLSLKDEAQGPQFEVELEGERPEYSFIKQEQIWAQSQQATADATHMVQIGIANPVASGQLVVLQTCFIASDTVGMIYRLGYLAGILAGGGICQPRDLRWRPGLGGSTRTFASGVAVAAGFTGIYAEMVALAANAVIDFMALPGRIPPVVIPPGFSVYISQAAVGANVATVHMAGYERPLESGELI